MHSISVVPCLHSFIPGKSNFLRAGLDRWLAEFHCLHLQRTDSEHVNQSRQTIPVLDGLCVELQLLSFIESRHSILAKQIDCRLCERKDVRFMSVAHVRNHHKQNRKISSVFVVHHFTCAAFFPPLENASDA